MRRGLVHVLAWLLATGAAVTLSWWGVRTVLAGTAYDAPRTLPITASEGAGGHSPTVTPTGTPTPSAAEPSHTPPGDAAPPPEEPVGTPDKAASRTEPPSGPAVMSSSPSPSASATGRVKGYDTDGGRAVFDLGPSSASLVSATPAAGWSMQVWKTEKWIRVEFASGEQRVSVFCTWHDSAPRVEIGTY
ncbi:hypothetical protein [Streptomyces sp. SID8352]|uniref:hypothetical protein n=1 Tax=Streptomyces sp. SID8352 TaxID=2690338 RepID=UPI00136A8C26|nr:hypothetical protein [Streptomyces sp. SID8352]MYU22191.1 hypothetical protein [Streptomyces sp. SID8352]